MSKGLSAAELAKLARIGASIRLAEIDREAAALRKAFPGLRAAAGTPAVAPPIVIVPAKAEGAVLRRGRRKPMSAAERKAVSERMKKYWADRRKTKR